MKRIKSKLAIRTETVRALDNNELQRVAGATVNLCMILNPRNPPPSAGCPSGVPALCGSGGPINYNTLACG